MMSQEKQRQTKYLQRRYEELPYKTQKSVLKEVILRLSNRPDYLDIPALKEIVKALKQDGWSIAKVIAHLDMIDIEERT